MQLGHCNGDACDHSHSAHSDFIVIDVNGLHHVNVDFCGCRAYASGASGEWHQQLLRAEWYPATVKEPQTVCTFRVLEHFHRMTLQGKLSAYDYYTSLEKLMDATGIELTKVYSFYKL